MNHRIVPNAPVNVKSWGSGNTTVGSGRGLVNLIIYGILNRTISRHFFLT